MADEWQPMKTAPRDGTSVLLGYRVRRPAIGYGYEHVYGWYCAEDDTLLNDPVSWKPLPPPPAELDL